MVAQSEDGLYPPAFSNSISIFKIESEAEENYNGWGLLGWDEDGVMYDIIHHGEGEWVWEQPPQGLQAHYHSWNNGFRLVMAHSRTADVLEEIPDPHPFTYNLWGTLYAIAHNGSLGEDAEDWWPLM